MKKLLLIGIILFGLACAASAQTSDEACGIVYRRAGAPQLVLVAPAQLPITRAIVRAIARLGYHNVTQDVTLSAHPTIQLFVTSDEVTLSVIRDGEIVREARRQYTHNESNQVVREIFSLFEDLKNGTI